jgi:hypothetical protein
MIDIVKVVEQCYQKLPANLKKCPWVATDHGRLVLQTEEQLDAYLAAYGEMHIIKCRAALQNLPCTKPNDDIYCHNFEIFDWGCGQGIATLTLLEFLQERGLLGRLNSITLVEPSMIALNRAQRWVQQNAGPAVRVKAINCAIPEDYNAVIEDISCTSHISINLFSNILDIKNLSLAWLAQKTASLGKINYMICVGPKFTENTRIKDFCGYFKPTSYFSNIESYCYAYTSDTHHPFSCETKCFVHLSSEKLNTNYIECASIQELTDDYDYAIDCLRSTVDKKTLNFYHKLRNECGNTYTIFLRPSIGLDIPDAILANVSHGIIIVVVCRDLANLDIDYKRVENIKSYLFNTHLKTIKIDSIINRSVYGCIKTAIYFPNSSQIEVDEEIERLNRTKNVESENDYYEHLIRLYDSDNYNDKINKVYARGFKFDYYDELVKIIVGHWHSYKDGDTNFRLMEKQKDIVRNDKNRLRVKGVAGSGKTQVVANRAVEKHLQTGEEVLILTFNISLIQYVRMRIGQVPADFSTSKFYITNYHQFFLSMANSYSEKRLTLADFDDPEFFAPYSTQIKRFKTIIIDEVQDFKTGWLRSIINYFLSPEGTISVFGDGEQNIYNREYESDTKMPTIPTYVNVPWIRLSERISMRMLNPKIAKLSFLFAKTFVDNSMEMFNVPNDLVFEKYWIKYWNVGGETKSLTLWQNIKWILQEHKILSRNTAVLSESINILRDIEKHSNFEQLQCMTNFETADEYEELRKAQQSPTLFQKDLKEIRRAAKTHFTTDCDMLKLSTIHSFKGWEAESIILLLQPEMENNSVFEGYYIQERENTPALIYTALTRAKCNLFIINLGNQKYHHFFHSNVNNNE